MVAIPIHKEKPGCILNSLLMPWLRAAADLTAGGYAEPTDVDKVWRSATGAPMDHPGGPRVACNDLALGRCEGCPKDDG